MIEQLTNPVELLDSIYDCQVTNYRRNGSIENRYTYKNKLLNGKLIYYDSSEKVDTTCDYLDGKVMPRSPSFLNLKREGNL
jgi:antitoxin component YwqK of YwqJK toxin-antitoxin module